MLQAEAETTLLGYGFYQEVSEEDLDLEFHDSVIEMVKSRPALILKIVTSITNYYRGVAGKLPLDEKEIKTRLLS